jgi:hypothetical protein
MRVGSGEAATPDGGSLDNTAALAHQRLRAKAMLTIHQRFGQEVRARRNLYAHLLDMQTRLEELRVPTDDGQEDRELLASGLLREGCAAVEAALADLARSTLLQSRLPSLDRDKRQNATRFVEAAKELGFDLERGGLPEALVTVPAERLEKTIRSRRGTLNALAMALLWSAESDADHPLRSVARARASFLLEIARLSVRRGHGDRPRLALQEVEPVARTILDLVETVLMYVP